MVLTITKAYYIVWYFMHLKEEGKIFTWSITIPLYILIPYLAFIVLVESDYINSVLFN
ncbi:hypothetical protein JBKA6_0604 [Ichthyobacterium seriolicida]|uniref:Cytochrome C oxidase subunit IV n=2 Tax=Ichthyobacterium seriolicida TaxID=242600 RepID=A0A1J1DXQ4_9FLAO|nr:hypothetical protein JBKA6_0604 [Ichthyobacterium seriolicida]